MTWPGSSGDRGTTNQYPGKPRSACLSLQRLLSFQVPGRDRGWDSASRCPMAKWLPGQIPKNSEDQGKTSKGDQNYRMPKPPSRKAASQKDLGSPAPHGKHCPGKEQDKQGVEPPSLFPLTVKKSVHRPQATAGRAVPSRPAPEGTEFNRTLTWVNPPKDQNPSKSQSPQTIHEFSGRVAPVGETLAEVARPAFGRVFPGRAGQRDFREALRTATFSKKTIHPSTKRVTKNKLASAEV
jgi:hypothetical protein